MSEQIPTSPKSPSKDEEAAAPLDHESLVVAVRKQIEYYFSKENLQQDSYLAGHMDANMSVPLSFVMKFSKMKALTQDESIVVKALEGSAITIVDGRIKAPAKTGGRYTIILREVSSDASEEEVREIFNYPGSKPISSIRSDIGDTWFVVMESEDDAKDSLLDLKLKKRTFRGQPVKGRMKSETTVRSFYPVPNVIPPVSFPGMPFPFPVAGAGSMNVNFGYPPVPGSETGAAATAGDDKTEAGAAAGAATDASGASKGARGDRKPAAAGATSGATAGASASSASGARTGAGAGARDGSVRDGAAAGASSSAGNNRGGGRGASNGAKSSSSSSANNGGDKDKKSGARGGAAAGKKEGGGSSRSGPAVEITPANFPPLMVGGSQTEEVSAIPTPGYKGAYLKYSFDDVINIVKSVQDTTLPVNVTPADHPISMTATPNMDLLQRQRTFSIDETREQLRQGRPVQREAIATGSTSDYGSMMYGEEFHSVGAPAGAGVARGGKDAKTGAVKKPATSSWAALVSSSPVFTPAPVSSTAAAAAAAAAAGTSTAAPAAAPATTTTTAGASATSSSWKRGDKVTVTTATAATTTTTGEKPAAAGATAAAGTAAAPAAGAAAAGANNGTPKKSGSSDKKRGGERGKKEGRDKKDGEEEKAEGPSSWGGKPTFANILKQQEAADAAAAAATAEAISNGTAAPEGGLVITGKATTKHVASASASAADARKEKDSSAPRSASKRPPAAAKSAAPAAAAPAKEAAAPVVAAAAPVAAPAAAPASA